MAFFSLHRLHCILCIVFASVFKCSHFKNQSYWIRTHFNDDILTFIRPVSWGKICFQTSYTHCVLEIRTSTSILENRLHTVTLIHWVLNFYFLLQSTPSLSHSHQRSRKAKRGKLHGVSSLKYKNIIGYSSWPQCRSLCPWVISSCLNKATFLHQRGLKNSLLAIGFES